MRLVLLDYKMWGMGEEGVGDINYRANALNKYKSTFDFIYISTAASEWRELEIGQEEVTGQIMKSLVFT